MGKINISLEFDKKTGKKNVIIGYQSDTDQMEHEHEARHREIVAQLLGSGVLSKDEIGTVSVSRGEQQQTGQHITVDEDHGQTGKDIKV